MIPKYYFLSLILRDQELTADILPEPPLSPLQCYQKRVLRTQQKIDQIIASLPEMRGPDILELIRQRDEILRRLNRHGSFWLAHSDQPFLPLLQRILRVSPTKIQAYSAALSQLLLETDVTVLLDEGKTPLIIEGKEYIAKTVLDSDYLTTDKCLEIVEKLRAYQCFPKKISFYLPGRRVYDYDVDAKRLTQREGEPEEAQFCRKIIQLR